MKNIPEIKAEKITSTLHNIIQLFEAGNVPEAIAIATFPQFDVPSSAWSLANRLLMMIAKTSDARGWQQWQMAGRYIKKGAKAFYILAPRLIKKEKPEAVEEENQRQYFCAGFLPIPVFSVESTDGEELNYEKLELPTLPLMEKAKEWGIEVKGVAFQGGYYGYYSPTKYEKIRLASPHEIVFFHELAHAAHSRVIGQLKNGQNPQQEIVAELSAQVLAEMVGTQMESTLGNSYQYIKNYADKMKKDVGLACVSVISDVEKVLKLILNAEEKAS